MLNEEVKKYRELTGDDRENVPISRIGGYLDGFERGKKEIGLYNIYDFNKAKEDGYNQGMKEVWEFVGEICSFTSKEMHNVFNTTNVEHIIRTKRPQEAMKKLKEYKSRILRSEEIKVGDEVKVGDLKPNFVVLNIYDNYDNEDCAYLINDTNGRITQAYLRGCCKTGRYFPQVKKLLEQMGVKE